MSARYDEYLKEHKANVVQAFEWLRDNLPELTSDEIWNQVEFQVRYSHDASKNDIDEYDAYDKYFYGNRSYKTVEDFNYAWLRHIHKNPHHWQHWILYNDEPKEPFIYLPIPENYIIEMICDWWSFSWKNGDLYEIFEWYEKHRHHIRMNDKSQAQIKIILDAIKNKLLEPYHQEIKKEVNDYCNNDVNVTKAASHYFNSEMTSDNNGNS